MSPDKHIENLRDVFTIFHDGGIESWEGDHNLLRLKIDCIYLAEKVNKNFEYFYLEIERITKISMEPWWTDNQNESVLEDDLQQIFRSEMELLSAEVVNGMVQVSFRQDDKSLGYGGGTLYLNGGAVRIFDEQKNPISLDELKAIATDYWDNFGKK